MNQRSTAALVRFAAFCGLLVAPSVAVAQLRCEQDSDKQIRRVTFEGNAQFTDAALAEHIIATPTDPTRRVLRIIGTKRCLRPGLLASDANRLRLFYLDEGFREARIDTATTTDGKWVDALFRISEGQPDLVGSAAINGIASISLGDDLAGKLNSRAGSRYSPLRVLADIDTIEARLRNSGYPLAVVLQEVQGPDTATHRAMVTLDVSPGPLTRIGRIAIVDTGVNNRAPVLAQQVIRDVLRFGEGDVYRERALYESERQFYRVGNFLSAEITSDTSHVRKDSLVDVTVRVLEDLMHIVTAEPGFGTLDCLRGRVEYTDKAFLGGLNKLEVSGQLSKIGWAKPTQWPGIRDLCRNQLINDEISSSVVNYNATIRVTRPVTLRGGLLPSFSAYRERRGAYKAYLRTTKIGGVVSLSKSLTRSIVGQASYNLEYGNTAAEQTVYCFFFRACDEATQEQFKTDKRLAILGLSFSRDRRDFADSTTRGTSLRLDLRTSQPVPIVGSATSLSFNKAVIDGSWYHRAIGSSVLAFRVRGGLIGGGLAFAGGRLPPPQERLYTGGETSVRGFSQNELGPLIYVTDDTTGLGAAFSGGTFGTDTLQSLRMRVIPAGGNSMYVANMEYRLRGPFLPTLQTILFVDVGKLWTQGGEGGREKPKWTPGVAFRYFSPVGPIQVNVGYNAYARPAGPVYYDKGVETGASLACLSGAIPGFPGTCQPAIAILQPKTFLRRLKISIAFPPDF